MGYKKKKGRPKGYKCSKKTKAKISKSMKKNKNAKKRRKK